MAMAIGSLLLKVLLVSSAPLALGAEPSAPAPGTAADPNSGWFDCDPFKTNNDSATTPPARHLYCARVQGKYHAEMKTEAKVRPMPDFRFRCCKSFTADGM